MKNAYVVVAVIVVIIITPILARHLYKFYLGKGYSKAISFFCSAFLSPLGTALIAILADIAVAVISGSIWLIAFLFQIPRLFF